LISENQEYKSRNENKENEIQSLRIEKEQNEANIFKQQLRIKELEEANTSYLNMKIQFDNIVSQTKILGEKLMLYRDYKSKFMQLSKAVFDFSGNFKNLIIQKLSNLEEEKAKSFLEWEANSNQLIEKLQVLSEEIQQS